MPNFQNNFATNLTSNTSTGATTSPINSIPTVDAPYYIAFDATNLNSHYEVVYVTSDTATNVNHAATTYDHTTAEEVRLVVPAAHLNVMQNFPRGFLINGKIVPTVASNNLTVAVKSLAGTDPSATDPVYCRIGDTVRSITTAKSFTVNAGTNWCNAGSAELATKEIDYFIYLFWSATDAKVGIGASRSPSFNIGSDINGYTTSEKALMYNQSDIVNFSGSDEMEVVGRFAATLSAGAGYTWTVPTFTAANLIQRPIYETRLLTATPAFTGFSVNPSNVTHKYKLVMDTLYLYHIEETVGTSNATGFTITMPFLNGNIISSFHCEVMDNTATQTTPGIGELTANSNLITMGKNTTGAAWTNSGSKRVKSIVVQLQI